MSAVFLEHLPSYPNSRCNWLWVVNNKGNGNTGVKQKSNVSRWSNRKKAAATLMKSVSMSCAGRVIDKRAWPIQTILVPRLSDVHSSDDKDKVRTRVAVSRDFSRGDCSFAFRAYKRVSVNGLEPVAKELSAR